MNRTKDKPWYKEHWKLALVGMGLAIILAIPSCIFLFKPQKVIITNPPLDTTPPEATISAPVTDLKSVRPLDEILLGTKSLRRLKPLETGKHPTELPDNIYGFAHVSAIQSEMESQKEKLNQKYIELSNVRDYFSYYEIQKINNECYLVGFISDEIFAKVGNLNKTNELELTLFASPWETFNNIVSIPFNSILEIESRRINISDSETILVLDLKTNKVITIVQGHDLQQAQ